MLFHNDQKVYNKENGNRYKTMYTHSIASSGSHEKDSAGVKGVNKFLIFVLVSIAVNSFSIITLNLHMMSDDQASDVLLDVKNRIEQLAPDYTRILFDSATPASYELFFFSK